MIRRFKLFLIAAMLLPTILLSGCVTLSLHPLSTGKDLVSAPALVGNWDNKDSKDSWTITQEGQKRYRFVYTDEDHKRGEFIARLVNVNGALFLDLFPAETNDDYHALLKLPVHLLFHVIRTKPTPQLAILSDDWLHKFLARHPNTIRHEKVDGDILLTASPREIQRFLVAHLNTKGAFDPGEPWRREAP